MQNFYCKEGVIMKKRLLAALMAGAMALSMTACGGSSSGEETQGSGDDSTATAGSYEVGVVQLVQHEALDAATQGFKDKLEELIQADGGTVDIQVNNASGDSANCTTTISLRALT